MSDTFEYNKDCLHCWLAKAIHDFFSQHNEEMVGQDIMSSMASLIGDIIEELSPEEQQAIINDLIIGVRERIEDIRKDETTTAVH